MKLYPVAEKLVPFIAAALLLLSHTKQALQLMPVKSFMGIVSTY